MVRRPRGARTMGAFLRCLLPPWSLLGSARSRTCRRRTRSSERGWGAMARTFCRFRENLSSSRTG
eukprot:10020321-Lingulodinium_polyedra.AAC.1